MVRPPLDNEQTKLLSESIMYAKTSPYYHYSYVYKPYNEVMHRYYESNDITEIKNEVIRICQSRINDYTKFLTGMDFTYYFLDKEHKSNMSVMAQIRQNLTESNRSTMALKISRVRDYAVKSKEAYRLFDIRSEGEKTLDKNLELPTYFLKEAKKISPENITGYQRQNLLDIYHDVCMTMPCEMPPFDSAYRNNYCALIQFLGDMTMWLNNPTITVSQIKKNILMYALYDDNKSKPMRKERYGVDCMFGWVVDNITKEKVATSTKKPCDHDFLFGVCDKMNEKERLWEDNLFGLIGTNTDTNADTANDSNSTDNDVM